MKRRHVLAAPNGDVMLLEPQVVATSGAGWRAGGEEGVFKYGDAAQPGHPPPAWGIERFKAPELLRFNEEFGVVILPE